jgi:hypothetical protein
MALTAEQQAEIDMQEANEQGIERINWLWNNYAPRWKLSVLPKKP